ncbi:Protein of unknown function [Gryllus bimaculatus]|nr:Protein of unknown function [Gryllus bimaculatus]
MRSGKRRPRLSLMRMKAENHVRIQNLILNQVALPIEYMAWDQHMSMQKRVFIPPTMSHSDATVEFEPSFTPSSRTSRGESSSDGRRMRRRGRGRGRGPFSIAQTALGPRRRQLHSPSPQASAAAAEEGEGVSSTVRGTTVPPALPGVEDLSTPSDSMSPVRPPTTRPSTSHGATFPDFLPPPPPPSLPALPALAHGDPPTCFPPVSSHSLTPPTPLALPVPSTVFPTSSTTHSFSPAASTYVPVPNGQLVPPAHPSALPSQWDTPPSSSILPTPIAAAPVPYESDPTPLSFEPDDEAYVEELCDAFVEELRRAMPFLRRHRLCWQALRCMRGVLDDARSLHLH